MPDAGMPTAPLASLSAIGFGAHRQPGPRVQVAARRFSATCIDEVGESAEAWPGRQRTANSTSWRRHYLRLPKTGALCPPVRQMTAKMTRATGCIPNTTDGQTGSSNGYATTPPTMHVLGFGISRKRLEQAIRELQLPVVVVRDADEADVVITLKNYYRQKPPALREAEERALPIYVLKSNTIVQMEACLTSLFAIEVDPREAALRETEEAIGLVLNDERPVELSPQNAYVRRLQHQMAEQANLVSQSRGREPFRRVRLYPDKARAWR